MLRPLRAVVNDYRKHVTVTRRFPDAVLEPGVQFRGDLRNLVLGPHVIIQSGAVIHLGGMDWCEFAGHVEIGSGSVISPGCVIYGCGPGGVRVGRDFDCGPGVGIFSSRTDYTSGPGHHIFAPVEIGDAVIIFANCVISPGVRIEDRVTIAAGSVVLDDLPSGCLAGGAPARVIRENVR